MTVFVVTWNINTAGTQYSAKRQIFLENLNRFENTSDSSLESVRWISTTLSANSLSDNLRAKLDDNDRIFVSRVYSHESAGWLNKDVWSWIQARC